MRIGAHVDSAAPLAEAAARGADAVQFFLTDPQGFAAPKPRDDADALRAAEVAVYVHAPYLVNVATPNNRIRIPSRKLLQQHMDAAASIGAKGLIVHGGHVNKTDDPEKGFDNWRKAIEATDLKIPLLIENTAGGDNAMARQAERIGRVFEAVHRAEGADMVGFCLDTCHAHAGGIALDTAVERLLALTGRIDLVHANDSMDVRGAFKDRHQNIGAGHIGRDAFRELFAHPATEGVPFILETPGSRDSADDLKALQELRAEAHADA